MSISIEATPVGATLMVILNMEKTLIEACKDRWHAHLKGELEGGLDELLADDVVFYSPIVFTALEGKDVAKLYLGAAGNTFSEGVKDNAPGKGGSGFRYVKEVASGNHTIFEFETTIDDKYINGVDIMTWNDEQKITEFKVMIRPLQAVNVMHEKMKAMLEKMGSV
jgi:hypothetical protein